jgi:hypothetical protein
MCVYVYVCMKLDLMLGAEYRLRVSEVTLLLLITELFNGSLQTKKLHKRRII